mgnify:CR=1 FL=1
MSDNHRTQRLAHAHKRTVREDLSSQKRVMITGAGRGLGLEFVRQYLTRGDLVFATVRDPGRLTGLADLQQTFGPQLIVVRLDVTKPQSIDAAVARVAASASRLDILINNAGINAMSRDIDDAISAARLGHLDIGVMPHMYQVNALGPLMVTQSALAMLKRGIDPRVINISSWKGSTTDKRRGDDYGYSASKAALNMITRALSLDLNRDAIAVVAIDPGWVSTDMGGPNAPLTPTDSVQHIIHLIDQLTNDHTGQFLRWNGQQLSW